MAVRVLGPDPAQVDYRLEESAGCDHQLEYRLDGTRPLEFFGRGLAAVGLTPGWRWVRTAGTPPTR